jgi:hypothetical protein
MYNIISGNMVAAATKRFLKYIKRRIRPAGLTIPEVFVKNVGLKNKKQKEEATQRSLGFSTY